MVSRVAIPELDKENARPTVWGLNPAQVHDRFWAARGVQVVRLGQEEPLAEDAELFLLTYPSSLLIFKLGRLVDRLSWMKPKALVLRLQDRREPGYREVVVSDKTHRFLRFQRMYGEPRARSIRLVLTPDAEVARQWRDSKTPRAAWRR